MTAARFVESTVGLFETAQAVCSLTTHTVYPSQAVHFVVLNILILFP